MPESGQSRVGLGPGSAAPCEFEKVYGTVGAADFANHTVEALSADGQATSGLVSFSIIEPDSDLQPVVVTVLAEPLAA